MIEGILIGLNTALSFQNIIIVMFRISKSDQEEKKENKKDKEVQKKK